MSGRGVDEMHFAALFWFKTVILMVHSCRCAQALDGLLQMMTQRSRVVLPYLVPEVKSYHPACTWLVSCRCCSCRSSLALPSTRAHSPSFRAWLAKLSAATSTRSCPHF